MLEDNAAAARDETADEEGEVRAVDEDRAVAAESEDAADAAAAAEDEEEDERAGHCACSSSMRISSCSITSRCRRMRSTWAAHALEAEDDDERREALLLLPPLPAVLVLVGAEVDDAAVEVGAVPCEEADVADDEEEEEEEEEGAAVDADDKADVWNAGDAAEEPAEEEEEDGVGVTPVWAEEEAAAADELAPAAVTLEEAAGDDVNDAPPVDEVADEVEAAGADDDEEEEEEEGGQRALARAIAARSSCISSCCSAISSHVWLQSPQPPSKKFAAPAPATPVDEEEEEEDEDEEDEEGGAGHSCVSRLSSAWSAPVSALWLLATSQLQLQNALDDEDEDDEPSEPSGDEVDEEARPVDDDWAVAEADTDELPALSANTLANEASPLAPADGLSALGVSGGESGASSLEPNCPSAEWPPCAHQR